MPEQVRLALPSKGRMEEETLDFFADCGLRINKSNPRQYSATIPAIPEILVLFQRARDVARSIANGDVDLGITGYDTIVDALGFEHPEIIILHEALGYGECSLVIAVPEDWQEDNLEALAQRASTQGKLRVATKHVHTAELFLQQKRLADQISVIMADGALEAAPTIGYADFIIDITSTGTTLKENRLKVIEDGTLVESEAAFIGNRRVLETRGDVLAITRQFIEFFEANLKAQGQYLVYANIRGESPDEVARRVLSQTELGGLQGPTISRVVNPDADGNWWSVSIVLGSSRLYKAIQQLRSIGGSGVIVTPATYIFEENPERYQRLLRELNRVEVTA